MHTELYSARLAQHRLCCARIKAPEKFGEMTGCSNRNVRARVGAPVLKTGKR